MIRYCLTCGKEFNVKPYAVRDGNGKYCSKACCHAGFTKYERVQKTCPVCGKVFTPLGWETFHGKGNFCSHRCFNAYQRESWPERFWKHVDKAGANGCWMWTGLRSGRGYGTLSVSRKPQAAHRLSWQLHNGPIPKGLLVCHTCDNRLCVNPSHLFLGTQRDNYDDMIRKGRWSPVVGDERSDTKLSEHAVREIRLRYAQGGISHHTLGKEYGVCRATIGDVVNRKKYKHVQ